MKKLIKKVWTVLGPVIGGMVGVIILTILFKAVPGLSASAWNLTSWVHQTYGVSTPLPAAINPNSSATTTTQTTTPDNYRASTNVTGVTVAYPIAIVSQFVNGVQIGNHLSDGTTGAIAHSSGLSISVPAGSPIFPLEIGSGSYPGLSGDIFKIDKQGNVSALGSVSASSAVLNGTGGNVPYGCTVVSTASNYASCGPSQYAIGGGVDCLGGYSIQISCPSSGSICNNNGEIPTAWYGVCSPGGLSGVYAVCCTH